MAVNEKVAYANSYVTHGGKLYKPGEQLSGRMDDAIIKHAEEGGLVTRSESEAKQAQAAEAHRREQVAEQQRTRSEAREPEQREQLRDDLRG